MLQQACKRSHATYRVSKGWLFFGRIFDLRKRGLFAYARRKRWYSEIRGIPEITLKLTEFSPEVAESRTDGGSKNGTGNGKGIEIEANGEDNNGAGNKNVDIGDQFGGRPIGSSFGGLDVGDDGDGHKPDAWFVVPGGTASICDGRDPVNKVQME